MAQLLLPLAKEEKTKNSHRLVHPEASGWCVSIQSWRDTALGK